MKNVIGFILGGGKGTRLFPLTQQRSKPAVPLAGKYRLIDIPISNCLNSGINRIYLLTQFNSVSLHRHIRQTYTFDSFAGGFVEILAAQQTIEGSDWYQGTADAVRKNIRYIEQSGVDYVAILSGDQLYRMDFQQLLDTHRKSGAAATIAGLPVTREAARAFGIMQLNDAGRVLGFVEKPKTDTEIDTVRMDPAWIDARGVQSRGRDCIASMGIYLFDRDLLVDLLRQSTHEDFGKEVFPTAIKNHPVHVHLFDGYWEDIGTIRSFYECNLDLAKIDAPFDFNIPGAPIYTRARFLPPTRIDHATVRKSLIADGCIVEEGAVIENSVVGLRCIIGRNTVIRDSVLLGNDYYQSAAAPTDIPLGIGANSVISGAIIDKNCCVAEATQLICTGGPDRECPTGKVIVRDGIAVMPKGTQVPAGWTFQ